METPAKHWQSSAERVTHSRSTRSCSSLEKAEHIGTVPAAQIAQLPHN